MRGARCAVRGCGCGAQVRGHCAGAGARVRVRCAGAGLRVRGCGCGARVRGRVRLGEVVRAEPPAGGWPRVQRAVAAAADSPAEQ